MKLEQLSALDARRIALGAQGFAHPRPRSRVGLDHVRRVANRLKAIQIDSVNVLVRSHYLPAFSRLGPYPSGALDRLAYERRELFEYWGHQASFLPVSLYPLFEWRRRHYESNPWWDAKDPKAKRYINSVIAQMRERGPLSASDLKDPGKGTGPWWGWSSGKTALEWLYASGRAAVAGRRGFERLYDLADRVIPGVVFRAQTPAPKDAKHELLVIAARAFGVATMKDLATYFYVDPWWHRQKDGKRRSPSTVPHLLAELVDDGRLVPVRVEGWKQQAYLHPEAKLPKAVDAHALISPFDSLVWERDRMQRLFGFNYTIEIYVPAPKRKFGYYVLPFLRGDELVARVDLKSDRKRSALLVQAAHAEPGRNGRRLADELGAELRQMAAWLGLERVEVAQRGDLAKALARAV